MQLYSAYINHEVGHRRPKYIPCGYMDAFRGGSPSERTEEFVFLVQLRKTQRAQYSLMKELGLNHIGDPYLIEGMFLLSHIGLPGKEGHGPPADSGADSFAWRCWP